jgi:hypothetical protein
MRLHHSMCCTWVSPYHVSNHFLVSGGVWTVIVRRAGVGRVEQSALELAEMMQRKPVVLIDTRDAMG